MNISTKLNTSKIIQITSGRGPEECCFVVSKVLKKMIKELKKHNCYHQVISRIPSDINGNLHSATLSVDVTNNQEVLSDWIGTIQWIGNSPFRRNHKRKNWFIGVFELENSAVKELEMKQVKFENTRSGGPGGQHVNKVSSAVRATHIPTGLMVKVSDTRSQIQNKKLAIVRLQELWNNHQVNKVKENNENNWRNHTSLLRGNPVKVFRENDFKKEPKPKKYKHDRSKENQKWKRELN